MQLAAHGRLLLDLLATAAIALGFSLVPAALTVLSLWWLRQYTLDPAQVARATEAGQDTGPDTGGIDG